MAIAEKPLQKPDASRQQEVDQFDERMRQAFREAIEAGVINPVPEEKQQA